MKKSLFILAAVALFTACGQGQKGDAADSLKNDTTAVEPTDAEMEGQTLYYSPDHAMLDLKSHVKTIKVSTEACNRDGKPDGDGVESFTCTFDEQGTMTKGKVLYEYDLADYKIKRNAEGRIINAKQKGDYDGFLEIRYTGERVASTKYTFYGEISGSSEATYHYDAEGNFTGATDEGVSDGIEFVHNTVYTIKETDEFGNWTKAIVKYTETDTEPAYEEGDSPTTTTNVYYRLITRKIEYYK